MQHFPRHDENENEVTFIPIHNGQLQEFKLFVELRSIEKIIKYFHLADCE